MHGRGMFRQIIGYVPSTVIPAVVSFLMIYVYTRLLTPAEYGRFSLVFSAILVIQTSLFFAVPMALTRFYPEALAQDRREEFLGACYSLFYGFSVLLLLLVGVVSVFILPQDPVLWILSILVLLARSAVVLNQSVNRISFAIRRFTIIECAHAVLGLGLGTIFIYWFGASAEAVVQGLLISALLCMAADHHLLLTPFRFGWRKIERAGLATLVRFSLPLIVVDMTVCLLTLSDRFLLGKLGGVDVLGIYTVAYSLVERPITLICTAITTATFPFAVHLLQDKGKDAAGRQVGQNGGILLALAVPACVGLSLTAPQMAAVMIGADFRAGVTALIPVLCVVALLRGCSVHIIDHAFQLAGRTSLAIWAYGPAAIANVVLNVVLIPRYGVFGAAWAGLAGQSIAVVAGWGLSRTVFPITLPIFEIAKTIVAAGLMAVLLIQVTFEATGVGLFQAIVTGTLTFAAAAIVLNIGGLTGAVLHRGTRAVENIASREPET
jgi:O-antigen/teichoic acid export membrane protein